MKHKGKKKHKRDYPWEVVYPHFSTIDDSYSLLSGFMDSESYDLSLRIRDWKFFLEYFEVSKHYGGGLELRFNFLHSF
jgi:hypothetical protein